MGRTKIIACVIAALALAACSRSQEGRALSVGSKNFTEQVVLGEIIAQHLERRLHQKVERKLNLGGTLLAHQALLAGEIDLYPEYSGTALVAVLKEPIQTDPPAVLKLVRAEYASRFHVAWLDSLGIDNGFAMVVRGSDKKLETLSNAARVPKPWALGVGYEFEQRVDGLKALQQVYALRSSAIKTMDLGLLYRALEDGQVTMIAANATDGLLSKLDVKVLDDDKHAFPPYELCIAAREDRLAAIPGLRAALAELTGKFTDRKMQDLNYQVDGRHRPVADIAAEFLQSTDGLK
ncbi:MAG: ABC transporter substrate-binding protein [Acidobacteriota bacterium]|nr:ABC transporter substrate-binding protein [Acidobacteriota bacterium]